MSFAWQDAARLLQLGTEHERRTLNGQEQKEVAEAIDNALGERRKAGSYLGSARGALRAVKQHLAADVWIAEEQQEEKQSRAAKRQKGADWDACQTCVRVIGRSLPAGVCLKMGQPGHLVAE